MRMVRMDFRLVCLEAFAIFVSYLVFSLAVASATNVNIYYNGVYQPPAVQYAPQSAVRKTVVVEAATLTVRVNITGMPGSALERVYVYKCGGLSPGSCAAGTAPEISAGSLDAAYPWSALADKASGYPQNANLLILAKVGGAPGYWAGFWHRIERVSPSSFVQHEYSLSEIQVHAKDMSDVSLIRSFISGSKMIPFNPNWVTKIFFADADGLYLAKSGQSEIGVPAFAAEGVAQNQLTGMDSYYGFAFANASGTQTVFNPIALVRNPDYVCGSSGCEAEKGESQANCCIDCGCAGGYYCDTGFGCRQVNGISLSLYGTPKTAVSNCNQQHMLNISVRIGNPPTGMALVSGSHKLGTNPYQATSCTGGPKTGHIFTCPVAVPAVPGCSAGAYRVGPNRINLTISYPDGKSQTSKTVSASFPDITIGSFKCGNMECEYSLDESQANCCYDCGCAGGYCNSADADPEAGSCKADPANSNLRVIDLHPANFYGHKSGDSASFLAQVAGGPVSLSVIENSCSIKCSRNDGQECSAGCGVSCYKSASSDQSVYNSTCSMSFSIAAYDPLKGYSLYPTLNISIAYKNGSAGTVQKVLSSAFQTISIGAHWCGDKKCDPDESPASCCYDCGCPEGQYCDTKNTGYPSLGDSCRMKPAIEIDSTDPVAFTDSYEQHVINVTGHIDVRPSGISMSPRCGFEDSDVPCYASCEDAGGSPYMFLCQLTIPPIDYRSSPYYNPESRKIVLAHNFLDLSLAYNNGGAVDKGESHFSIPDIGIGVVPRCGNEICEGEAGETGKNCCPDCGCAKEYGKKHFCYTGKTPSGECLPISKIDMRIRETSPEPVGCIIFEKGGSCIFTQSLSIYPEVLNPPSDLEVAEAYYRIGTAGAYTPISCYGLEGGKGNYSCAIMLEDIAKTKPGTETRTIDLGMTLAYTLDGALMVANVSDQADFTISRTYTEALASCIEQEKSIDEKLEKLERDKSLYTALAAIFFLISLLFWWKYFACKAACSGAGGCPGACERAYMNPAIIAGTIAGCALAFVLNKLSKIDDEINQLKAQKETLCASSSYSSLSSSVSSTGNTLYAIGKVYGGVTCALGAMSIVGGFSSTASVGGTGTNVGGGASQNIGNQLVNIGDRTFIEKVVEIGGKFYKQLIELEKPVRLTI